MNSLQKSVQWLSGRSLSQVIFAGAALAGGFVVFQRHQELLFAYLPYLVLLACPLMHIFMHRGHGHGGSASQHHGEKEES